MVILLASGCLSIKPYFASTGNGSYYYYRPDVGMAICADITAFAVGMGIGIGIGAIIFDRGWYRRGSFYYGKRRKRDATSLDDDEEMDVKTKIYGKVRDMMVEGHDV